MSAATFPVFANPTAQIGEVTAAHRWRSSSVRIAISSSLLKENPNIKHNSDVAGAIRRSLETWSRVANLDLVQVASEKLSASPAGIAGDGVSLITIAQTPENVLLFSKDPEGAAATTRVFYNRRGVITEADIVLNPFQQFSTDGTIGTFDLESTLTHELGHLLGLPHSEVLGSTMHANYGKNGVFGLQRFNSRTLSAADIALTRALYGIRGDDSGCCGTVEGKLPVLSRQGRTFEVWIEDLAGRVHGSMRTTTGEFSFAGLSEGKYRLFAHEPGRSKGGLSVHEIGLTAVLSGETATVNPKASSGPLSGGFALTHVGFNGQLSEMAVSIAAGRSYLIYLGGRNLDPKDLSVSFSSAHLAVVPGTMRSLDYGDDISVVSFEVRVSRRAAQGDYSIFAETRGGEKHAIIGALTIDRFASSSSSFSVLND